MLSLVDSDASLSVNEYLEAMKSQDEKMRERYLDASKNNEKLAYVALDEKRDASVSLTNLSHDHPFFGLKGTENIIVNIQITTVIIHLFLEVLGQEERSPHREFSLIFIHC